MKPGKTGDFPEGKLNEDDEGGLVMSIGYDSKKNVVVINFGTPVMWVGMAPEQAIEFANLIIANATRG